MKTSTVNLKHILAALPCVSTEETRYYLNGVCVEIHARKSFAVATDGQVLFVAHHALEENSPDNTLLGSFILSSATVKAVKIKWFADPTAAMTQLDAATVKLVCDGRDYYLKLVDGTFPDWRRVLPNDAEVGEIAGRHDDPAFNLDALLRFKRSAVALGSGRSDGYSLAHNGDGPASIRFDEDSFAYGVIMPYRRDAKRGKRPSWIDSA